MPTYDYRCSSCRHEFELFQSMKDAAKRKCPACGKNTLERLIGTGAAILFKGSGFYETDYRSESYRKAAEADKPGEHKAEPAKAGAAKDTPAPSAGDSKAQTPGAPVQATTDAPSKPRGAEGSTSAGETKTRSRRSPSKATPSQAPKPATSKAAKGRALKRK